MSDTQPYPWVIGALLVILLACAWQAAPVQADLILTEPSLVAYWMLDEAAGSATIADSKDSNTGTVYGGTTLGQASGMSSLGTSAHFNDINGRIDVPYNVTFNTPQFTVEAWARSDGQGSEHGGVISFRRDSPTTGGYMFYDLPNSANWNMQIGNGGWPNITGPTTEKGRWVQLAGSYDGSTLRLYVNGNLAVAGTTTFNQNDRAPFQIGTVASYYYFNGNVDNVAVFNQALADQKVSDHYNSFSRYGTRVLGDTPKAYWRLGEQNLYLNKANDAAGALDGTYANVTVRQHDVILIDDVDTAADFNGSSSKVTVPYTAALNPVGDFSVELWAKVEGGQGSYRSPLTSRSSTGGGQGYLFYAGQDNLWQFWTGDGDGTGWDITAGPAVALNQWIHLVGTFDWDGNPADANGGLSGTKSLYVNGELFASAPGKYKPLAVANPLFIGAGDDGGGAFFFNGKIDEVAVYDYALSKVQVLQHFVTAVPEPSAGVLLAGGIAMVVLLKRRRKAA